jgi:hypothetical protein
VGRRVGGACQHHHPAPAVASGCGAGVKSTQVCAEGVCAGVVCGCEPAAGGSANRGIGCSQDVPVLLHLSCLDCIMGANSSRPFLLMQSRHDECSSNC